MFSKGSNYILEGLDSMRSVLVPGGGEELLERSIVSIAIVESVGG